MCPNYDRMDTPSSRLYWIGLDWTDAPTRQSRRWWSNKHNMHHALTNEVGYDEDIALDPFIFLWKPDPKNDLNWLRR